jgi:hypothetical protein
MRVWDIHPKHLCRKHLLGEHRELHAIYSILANNKQGYRNHPETKRWVGKLRALYTRHGALVKEMGCRGYNHASPLDRKHAKGAAAQKVYVHTPAEQRVILKEKGCECRV